jgi:hypothetical protein
MVLQLLHMSAGAEYSTLVGVEVEALEEELSQALVAARAGVLTRGR